MLIFKGGTSCFLGSSNHPKHHRPEVRASIQLEGAMLFLVLSRHDNENHDFMLLGKTYILKNDTRVRADKMALEFRIPNFMRKFSHVFWDWFVCLFVCMFVCLFVCFFVCLFLCLLYVFHWPLVSADLSQPHVAFQTPGNFSLLVDLLLRSFEREKEGL